MTHTLPLAEACEINPRHDLKGLQPATAVSFVAMSQVSEQSCSVTSEDERPLSEVANGYTHFRNGDVLVAKITPCYENGKITVADIKHELGFGSTEFHVFRPRPELLDSRYLFYMLRSPHIRAEGAKRMTGSAGQKRVPIKFFKELNIFLPSLEDQKQIVSLLDQADALRRKRKESMMLLDQYVESMFIEMFGDPVMNPKRWDAVRFDRLGKFVSGGTPSKQNKAYWMGDFPWVSPKDMKHFYIDDAIDHVSEIVFQDTSLKKIAPNTLLIVVRGMILAHSFPVAINRVPVSINQDMKAVKLDESIRPLYAKIALDCMKSKILSHVSTAAHGTKRFDAEGMKKIFVPVPPINLQDVFCAKLEIIEKMKNSMKMQSVEMSQQFNALTQKTFAGAL